MAETSIEWTHREGTRGATWNPLRGCSEISPGCLHCYAAVMAYRFSGPGQPYEGLVKRLPNGKIVWTGKIRTVPEKLGEPLRARKPTTYFVNSMSDLFHPDVPDEFIHRVFCVMAIANWHTYQILTKRAERAASLLSTFGFGYGPAKHPSFQVPGHAWSELRPKVAFVSGIYRWPLPNVWLGVSVEDQKRADERIPHLLRTPAAVRFLSVEPLLESVDLRRWVHPRCPKCNRGPHPDYYHDPDFCDGVGAQYLPPIDLVIVGGESGHGARPMHPAWARSLRDQCQAAGIAYFFKQFGEWAPIDDDTPRGAKLVYVDARGGVTPAISPYEPGCPCDHDPRSEPMVRLGKKRAGRLLDGREWNEFPQVSARA